MVSLAANWDAAGRRECNDAHLHGGIELDDRPDRLRGWRGVDYGHRIPGGNRGSRMNTTGFKTLFTPFRINNLDWSKRGFEIASSLVRLCGPRSPEQFGNTSFLVVLPHNSHRYITVVLWPQKEIPPGF